MMKNVSLILICFFLTGCEAYKFRNFSPPQFSDGKVTGIPLHIKYSGNFGMNFRSLLRGALIQKGFIDVIDGPISANGYSVDIQAVPRQEANASVLMYVLTFGVFPANIDIFEDINITFYKDGVVKRSVKYKSNVTKYFAIIPTSFIVGDTANVMQKEYTAHLARNIALDYSANKNTDLPE